MSQSEIDSRAKKFEAVRSGESVHERSASSESDIDFSQIGKEFDTSETEGSDGVVYAPISPSDRHELTRLATHLSRRASSYAGDDKLRTVATFDLPDDDPVLNPEHKSFNLTKWLKVFMRNLDQEGISSKRAGIVFKNLNVSGTGAALQLQQTMADIVMAPIRIGEMFGSGRKQHKPILRNFEGVLKGGELLVVLGRPGSGCSTFLKSLTGELHGLDLDKNSSVHYNGKASLGNYFRQS
jgi:ATP-binding cassette subfamily G (WHITE) protein 2 (PDR)